jgi:hypothetical protein
LPRAAENQQSDVTPRRAAAKSGVELNPGSQVQDMEIQNREDRKKPEFEDVARAQRVE